MRSLDEEIITDSSVQDIPRDRCCTPSTAQEPLAGAHNCRVVYHVVQRTDVRMHATLQALARGHPVSYPHIIIRGHYVGGNQELQEVIKSGELPALLTAAPVPFGVDSYPPSLSVFHVPPPALCGYFLQMQIYANVVRCYSLLHTIIFAALLAADAGSTWFLYVLLVDLVLVVLAGPIPAPFGVLASAMVTSCKGAAVTAIPYKVVFTIYAIAVLLVLFFDRAATGTYVTFAINSSMLAVFRF